MKKLSCSIVLWLLFLASPSLGQGAPATVKLCIPTSGTACPPVTASAPLPVTGSFSATLSGFTPNGNYGTLTATAATSASTAMPAGTSVAFQNLSAVDVSCVLSAGAATATTNKLIVRGGATVYYTVGSNVNAACINQTGAASNTIAMAGGTGLGTNFGGGGSGGGGGAVTLASGAVASGAYSSGSIASGAFASGSVASGAYASGALASGAVVDLTNLSTPIAAGAATATKGLLLGGQYDSTQKTLTNGQQAALSASARGALFVAVGADGFAVTNAGTFAVQATLNATPSLANGNGVVPTQGGAILSATNGIFANVLQGNAVLSQTNPSFASVTDGTNKAAVKAASTAPVAADPALTVSLSPNVGGITPVVSSALESNHVIKAGAGVLISGYVTTGAVQGWLLVSNSTTAPTAGGAAIAPIACVYAPANATTSIGGQGGPSIIASTGITLVFSSSGCLTNTASSTVFLSGQAL